MITSPTNPTLKLIRALQSKRRTRETEGAFVIEGVRLLEEAARAGLTPRTILHTPELDERSRAAIRSFPNVPAQTVTPALLASVSETDSPAGVLAIVPFPSLPLSSSSFSLILDRISDPGNLGTLLRTAEAAGAAAAYLMPGTVDAYNPKVVRAAMGAHFRLPIVEKTWEALPVPAAQTWVADLAGEAYTHVNWRTAQALIIGSEADGPSEAALAFTPHRVTIPMPGRAESLNAAVAAGILLFEAARKRQGP
ncbi:MAG: RNA methyltransferase [Anaerolineales bacterium]|nr:RNA methyltransferase [Anaerolineales bacterium]